MMTVLDASLKPDVACGFVYVIYRRDLRKCYVGQSIDSRRPLDHARPGTYQYDELYADGGFAELVIAQRDVVQGLDLDAAEQTWMLNCIDEGWTLINRRGPGMHWPTCTREAKVLGGQRGGKIGGAAVQRRRKSDPEFNSKMREAELRGLAQGLEARRALWVDGGEWAAKMHDHVQQLGFVYGPKGGRAVSRLRRTCNECGMGPTTPGALGKHQAFTGHEGHTVCEPGTAVNPVRVRLPFTERAITARTQCYCVECGLGPTTPGGLGSHQKSTGHVGKSEVAPVTESKG